MYGRARARELLSKAPSKNEKLDSEAVYLPLFSSLEITIILFGPARAFSPVALSFSAASL